MNKLKGYSRYCCYYSVIAERFKRTTGDLLRRSVFEKSNANWIDETFLVTKRYNNTKHSSTKLTPTQASLKKYRSSCFQKHDKQREKMKSNFNLGDLGRTAGKRNTFPEGHTTT